MRLIWSTRIWCKKLGLLNNKHPQGTQPRVIRPQRSMTMRGQSSFSSIINSHDGLLSAHLLPCSPGHQVTCMQSPNATTKIGSLWGRKSSWYLAPLSVLWRPDKSDDGVGWQLLLRLHLTDNSCQYLIGPPAVMRSCQGFWAGNVLRILSHHTEEKMWRFARIGRLQILSNELNVNQIQTQKFIVIAQEQRNKMGNVKHKPRSKKNRQKARKR